MRLTAPARPLLILHGTSVALFHFSAAVKSFPPFANFLPDLTITLFLVAIVLSIYFICCFIYTINFAALIYLIHQQIFAFVILFYTLFNPVVNKCTEQKLFDLLIVAPLITILAYSVSGNAVSLEAFFNAVLFLGVSNALWLPLGVKFKLIVLGGPIDGDTLRVQYQIVGFAITSSACIVAARLSVDWPKKFLFWLFLFFVLFVGCLMAGGRAALVTFIAATFAVFCIGQLVCGRNIIWVIAFFGLVFFLLFFHFEIFMFGGIFEVSERTRHFVSDFWGSSTHNVRLNIWRLGAQRVSFNGAGVGTFGLIIGLNDCRRWHAHNFFLGALFEGGVVGFLLAACFPISAFLIFVLNRRCLSKCHFIILNSFIIIFVVHAFTSADFTNRMAWMWLGLLSGTAVSGNKNGSRNG